MHTCADTSKDILVSIISTIARVWHIGRIMKQAFFSPCSRSESELFTYFAQLDKHMKTSTMYSLHACQSAHRPLEKQVATASRVLVKQRSLLYQIMSFHHNFSPYTVPAGKIVILTGVTLNYVKDWRFPLKNKPETSFLKLTTDEAGLLCSSSQPDQRHPYGHKGAASPQPPWPINHPHGHKKQRNYPNLCSAGKSETISIQAWIF